VNAIFKKSKLLAVSVTYAVAMLAGGFAAAEDIIVGGKNVVEYLPLLEKAKQRILPRDPETGLFVGEVKPNLFVVNDGVYLSAFLKTGDGIIVFDAPDSYGSRLPQIIKKHVPDEDIKYLVYSHSHKDHIGGSNGFKNIENLQIVAQIRIAETLKHREGDLEILLPTQTFQADFTLPLGGEIVEMKDLGNFHSSDADTFIYFPHQKFLYVIDSIEPAAVPFRNFGMTENIGGYLTVFDKMLSYDFDMFTAGHLDSLGTRKDVEDTKAYVHDVKLEAQAALDETPVGPLIGRVFEATGDTDNTFLAFNYFLETAAKKCSVKLVKNWSSKLVAVDIWAESHCAIMQNYLRTH